MNIKDVIRFVEYTKKIEYGLSRVYGINIGEYIAYLESLDKGCEGCAKDIRNFKKAVIDNYELPPLIIEHLEKVDKVISFLEKG